MTEPVIQIISASRPHRVEAMQELVGLPALWYVPKEQVADYRAAGAETVAAGKLIPSRNQALEDAHSEGKISVQVADDLMSIKFYDGSPEKKLLPRAERFEQWTFKQALDYMLDALAGTPYKLAGAAPNTNELNYKSEFQNRHFICVDLNVALPSTPRFDSNMTLKEDYDYTCQHIAEYGGVLRCSALMPHFLHRTNEGGTSSVRNEAEEKKNIDYLLEKWPKGFVRHRKDTEIILRWRYPEGTP